MRMNEYWAEVQQQQQKGEEEQQQDVWQQEENVQKNLKIGGRLGSGY